jgi:glycine/D-amino acid oxidase-like deaminating enzyme
MQHADVIIVGGGVGGLSCAITIASACTKSWFGDRSVLVIDDGQSDLAKARLNNAPGIAPGTRGSVALQQMRSQLSQYPAALCRNGTVTKIHRNEHTWIVHVGDDDGGLTCDELVLATGYKPINTSHLPIDPIAHPRGGKSDRIMLKHDGMYRVAPHLHVAGLLGGGSSQFAIAAGIGAQVGVEILSCWAGKRTHVHDVPETPVT